MRASLFFWPLLAALCAGPLTGCQRDEREELLFKSDERYLPRVGKPSPPLKFKAIDGREVDLEQLKGKVVLLDFWATWCPPCMEELPHVRDAYERYEKHGLVIIGVSFDVDKARLEEVVKREQIRWPQYFDGLGRDAAPGKAFGIQHWPSMWLLDRNGVIRFISAGARLDRKITALLKEEANPVNAARSTLEQKRALDQSGNAPTNSPSKPNPPAPAPAAAGKTNAPGSTNASAAITPPAPVIPKTKLGDHPISVRNITITAKRSTAILQIGPSTHTVAVGTELSFPADGQQRKARCAEITRDEVVIAIEGAEGSLRLHLP